MTNVWSDKKRGRPKRTLEDNELLMSSKGKGDRLKWIRNLANLSQEELSANSGINQTTIKSWEQGRFGGLTSKGADRIVKCVAQRGVFCTVEWLLYEVGIGPKLRADYKKTHAIKSFVPLADNEIDEMDIILQELLLFRKLNRDPLDYIVHDEGMLPHYQIGDYVAGTKRVGDAIKSLIGLDCLVITQDGLLIMRNLQAGPKEGFYNLVCTNLHAKVKNTVLFSIELAAAAPVLWHRSKQPNKSP